MLLIFLLCVICLGEEIKKEAVKTFYIKDFSNGTVQAADKQFDPKIYGVSLGGWLVLEPWITPSIFEEAGGNAGKDMAVDEYTLSQKLGHNGQEVLTRHWSSFYKEEDVKAISDYGLNLVRVPIGYWAFQLLEGDPYFQGQEKYLDQMIEWCNNYNLLVQVDIHGMPGSQNGFDNSGKRTDNPMWLEESKNINLSLSVLDYVMDKYKDVHSINVVNEPFAPIIGMDKLQEFYTQAYEMAQRKNLVNKLVLHDGFTTIGEWDGFLTNTNITMDHHIYEIFTEGQIALTIDQHVNNIRNVGQQMKSEPHESIVGEFSGALTDCTKYINGVGRGARYDGTFSSTTPVGSCEGHENFTTWTQKAIDDTRRYIEVQMQTYQQNSKGWIFWCFKTENTIEWDFRKASDLGLIPSLSTLIQESENEINDSDNSIMESHGKSQGSQLSLSVYKVVATWVSILAAILSLR